jgi:hypothetical protein
MDALGIIYPQYWLEDNCEANFEKHLQITKEHYGQVRPFSIVAYPEGSIDPILSLAKLDIETTLFKQCMQENAHKMMKKPITLNPVTRLWRSIRANNYLKHALSEYIIVAEIATVMVLGSVQDERTFSTVSFMKSKLQNKLTMNLQTVVAFKSQHFYTVDTFPYDEAYDSWR